MAYTTQFYSNHLARTATAPVLRKIALLLAVRSERKALSKLSPEQRSDVGISVNAANAETARQFWDVPAHWLQLGRRC